jgi:hypothetical protein
LLYGLNDLWWRDCGQGASGQIDLDRVSSQPREIKNNVPLELC